VDSQQQIWIGFSKSLTTNIQQSSNLGFGSGDRRKRSATCREESGDTTTHNNNKKQVSTTNAENARWNHLGRKEGRKEGRRRTLPSLPPSLQLLLEEEHKETLTIIATVIFGLV